VKEVLRTDRLTVRFAGSGDEGVFHSIWTDPSIMAAVGFPQGIPVSLEELDA